MKAKITTTLISIVTVFALAVFVWTGVHALWYAPDTEIAPPVSTSAKPTAPSVSSGDLPEQLSIPAINIDANIQDVGINGKGNMAVPSNFTDVAWYKYGPVPGRLGSAVIDGHVDNGLGLDGVFKHLGDLHVGDDVFVDTKSGTHLHFVVHEIESYPYQDAPVERIFKAADRARLNLVTCEGAWVKGDKTYDHRLVVYAELSNS
jgi:sortase (surface protein transpeptidase)